MYVVKLNIIQMEPSTLDKTRVSHARAMYVLNIYYKKVQKNNSLELLCLS